MCVVHRIVEKTRYSNLPLRVERYEEHHIAPRPCFEGTTTFTVRHSEPAWERSRRIERARLTGTAPMSGIEAYRLSPQSGGSRFSRENLDDSGDYSYGSHSGFRGHRENARNTKSFGRRLKLAAAAPVMQMDLLLP
jgi:hypothetical protein